MDKTITIALNNTSTKIYFIDKTIITRTDVENICDYNKTVFVAPSRNNE